MTTTLILERKGQADKTGQFVLGEQVIGSVTPAIDEDYWLYRVRLTQTQAVVAFPKFGTIGIGFAVEEDWNTNLPWTTLAEKILDHIWHNAGPGVDYDDALDAIRLIQHGIENDQAHHG